MYYIKKIIKSLPGISLLALYSRNQFRRYSGRIRLNKQLSSGFRKLVIGADQTSFEGWLISDIESLNLLIKKDWQTLFGDIKLDMILAEHVWEHLTKEQGELAAMHCFEQLKEGGHLRVAVPDGNHPDPDYIQQVKIGGTGHSAHDHKVLYTIDTFSDVFKSAGFKIRPLEYFDEQGSFHQQEWDEKDGYVRRTLKNDPRNKNGQPVYTSIVLDAVKSD